jgi:hypothetical protein
MVALLAAGTESTSIVKSYSTFCLCLGSEPTGVLVSYLIPTTKSGSLGRGWRNSDVSNSASSLADVAAAALLQLESHKMACAISRTPISFHNGTPLSSTPPEFICSTMILVKSPGTTAYKKKTPGLIWETRPALVEYWNQIDQFGEIDDQKKLEEPGDGMLSRAPGWFALILGLAFAVGFLGVSAFQQSYGIVSGKLRWILMLLLIPVEWAGALLILALFDDFKKALERK